MTETADASVETLSFKSELRQVLHLITHSLYSHKEVFLRELISNASDAINKVRFNSIENETLLEDNKDWKIKLTADPDQGILIIEDNGIGMSREIIVDQLGTIAKSGTREFLEMLKQASAAGRPDLIGQFGVGFYSAFMVADRVTVRSRRAGDLPNLGVEWSSDGQGEFMVKQIEKPQRGTEVVLHLKEEEKEFLDAWRLRQVVREVSDFIEYPVVMDVSHEHDGKTEIREETLNSMKALWLRSKNEVGDDEYNAFYRQISNDFNDPAKVIHYTGEGTTEFKVLLFIPSKRPFDLMFGDPKVGPALYIQRVRIMDHCEDLLPACLRFVRGVVDCSDLPLNVSREILQQNKTLERIRKNIVRRIFQSLEEMKRDAFDTYVSFFRELGVILKEGVAQDWENRDQILPLLVYESLNTEAEKYISLESYVEKMPPDQEEIYFLAGEHRGTLENTPYLEVFRDRGWDVLFMTDPIDEFVAPYLTEFKGKKFKAADRGDTGASELAKARSEENERVYRGLMDQIKAFLSEVREVRLSSRLKESPSCLVGAEDGVSANMERIMQRMGQPKNPEARKRILEINADHPVVQGLQRLYDSNPQDPRVENIGRLLYEQAVVGEGSRLKDPAGFARRINDLLVRDLLRM